MATAWCGCELEHGAHVTTAWYGCDIPAVLHNVMLLYSKGKAYSIITFYS